MHSLIQEPGQSLRNFKEKNQIIDYCIGIAVGAGGFGEITIIGMLCWVVLRIDLEKRHGGLIVVLKDLAIINMAALVLLFWAYIDPYISLSPDGVMTSNGLREMFCPANGMEGLTWKELVKVIVLAVFGITTNHSKISQARRLIIGIAAGLLLYIIPTIVGSIAFQGLRMGGNKVYDIFSNELTAQSTTAGYLVIIIIGIFAGLEKLQALALAILVGFITGVQTSNRSAILFSLLATIYYIYKSPFGMLVLDKVRKYRAKCIAAFLATITLSTMAAIQSDDIVSRISAAIDGRGSLYLQGYSKLAELLINPNINRLGDAWRDIWWHSTPLDAARSAGFLGAILAIIWFSMLFISMIKCARQKEFGECLLCFSGLFLFLSGMPIYEGAYELVALYSVSLLALRTCSNMHKRVL